MENELDLLNLDENPNEQELQNLKENLLTQTEELRNLINEAYDKKIKMQYEFIFILDVLESEIELNYKLEELLRYWYVLSEFSKWINESIEMEKIKKIRKDNQRQELTNLIKRAKRIQKIILTEKDKKLIKKNTKEKAAPEYYFLAGLIAFMFIMFVLACFFPVDSLASIICFAMFFLGLPVIGSIGMGIINLVEYFRQKNIKSKFNEFIEQINKRKEKFPQREKNTKIETITEQKSLFLYFKHELLLQVKKLESEFNKNSFVPEFVQKLTDLKNEINESKTLADLEKFIENLFIFINDSANVGDEAILKLKSDISQIKNKINNAINKLNAKEQEREIEQNEQQPKIPKRENIQKEFINAKS